MRVCKDCNVSKPFADFHKNKNRKDGITIICKPCAVARSKKWQQAHRDRVNARYRKNYANNLEESRRKRRERVRRWYAKNAESQRLRTRQYSKLNPEIKRASEQRRRIRKTGNGEFFILSRELNKLLSSSCANCGSKEAITLDHIIPISRGGRHSIGNIQPLCRPCNSSKNNKTITEWRMTA